MQNNNDIYLILGVMVIASFCAYYVKKNPSLIFDSGLNTLVRSASMGVRG